MKAIITEASRTEKRALMNQAAKSGQMFSVEFVKKDKTVRKMQCKAWVERHYADGSKNAGVNTVAHLSEYYTVSDVGAADAFRNINLDNLKKLVAGGKEYVFI